MNNLPMKQNNSIFQKIRRFINKIINPLKKKNKIEIVYENQTPEVNNNNFKESLQREVKREKSINDIMDLIDKNPEILDNLSIEKLSKIDSLYNQEIEKDEEDISNLMKQIENIQEKINRTCNDTM